MVNSMKRADSGNVREKRAGTDVSINIHAAETRHALAKLADKPDEGTETLVPGISLGSLSGSGSIEGRTPRQQ